MLGRRLSPAVGCLEKFLGCLGGATAIAGSVQEGTDGGSKTAQDPFKMAHGDPETECQHGDRNGFVSVAMLPWRWVRLGSGLRPTA